MSSKQTEVSQNIAYDNEDVQKLFCNIHSLFLDLPQSIQNHILQQLLQSAGYTSTVIKNFMKILSVVLIKDVVYSRSIYKSNRYLADKMVSIDAMKETAMDKNFTEEHIKVFNILNRRQRLLILLELLHSGNACIIYETYWLCRRMLSGIPIYEHLVTMDMQRSSQEVETTGYQTALIKDVQLCRHLDKMADEETAASLHHSEEVLGALEGTIYNKEEIEKNLKLLRELWKSKIKVLQQAVDASGKNSTVAAKKPARSAKQKKSEGKMKEAVSGSLDWVQLLPLWVNRAITRMVDEDARKTMHQVNSYWDYMVTSTEEEAAVRQSLDASIAHLQEKIAGSSIVEDESSEDPEDTVVPVGQDALEEDNFPAVDSNIFSGHMSISRLINEFLHSRAMVCGQQVSHVMAVSTKHNTVTIFSLLSGKMLQPMLAGHVGTITCMRFHPNATHLVTGSSDTTVRCWNIWSCTQVKLYHGHRKRVTCLSVDEEHVASGDEDGRIRVFQVWSGMCVSSLQEDHVITAVQHQRNSRLELFSGCSAGDVTQYDVLGSTILQRVRGHRKAVTSLSLQSPFLASSGTDGRIRLWDCRDLSTANVADMQHGSGVRALHLSGPHVASGGQCGRVKVWHTATGKLLRVVQGDSRPVLNVHCEDRKDCAKVVVNTDLSVMVYNFGPATQQGISKFSVPQHVFGTSSIVEGLSDITRIVM